MGKLITICGSMRYQDKMVDIARKLELENKYLVMQCVYGDIFSKEELAILGELHYEKIEKSDAIFVVNVDGYIGSSTKREIEYAMKLGKEVLYLEEPIKTSDNNIIM